MTSHRQPTAHAPTFRYMHAEEVDEVFNLIQVAFGEGWPNLPIRVAPIEHLKWKVGGPQARPDDVEVICVDDRIVGYTGGSSRDVWVQGQRIQGWQGGDACIRPDFQGRGLVEPWREWRNAPESRVRKSVGIGEGSTHPRLRWSRKRRGDRVFIANKVDNLTLYLKAPGIRRNGRLSARSVLNGARLRVRILVNRMRWSRFSTPAPALTMRTVEEFDERADAFWERARVAFDYAVVRDRQHLNWRFCDPRAGTYSVRSAERDGELVGFIVTAFRSGASQVVDVLALPGDEGALRALIEDAIATVGNDEATSLTVLMPRTHPYRETFHRYGFIPTKWISDMGYRERKDSLQDFLEADKDARLHIAFGDTDHI